MKTRKLLTVGFLTLLVINGLLVFLLMSGSGPHPRGRGPGGPQLIKVISDKLVLAPDQVEQFQELARNHHAAMQKVAEAQQPLILSYFDLLNYEDSIQLQEQILDQLLILEREKLTLTYSHFEALKEQLDPDQRDRFGSILEDITMVLLGREKKNPPPPRDR
ncbi:MAG: hypothetical protein AAGA85_12210 [Bacteroidota bacterium]